MENNLEFQLEVEPYCSGCDNFNPSVTRLYADGVIFMQNISCENINHCRRISEYIKRGLEREVE